MKKDNECAQVDLSLTLVLICMSMQCTSVKYVTQQHLIKRCLLALLYKGNSPHRYYDQTLVDHIIVIYEVKEPLDISLYRPIVPGINYIVFLN